MPRSPEDIIMDREADVTWRRVLALRIDALEKQILDNTRETLEIKKNTDEMIDIFKSWKGAMKVLSWIGKLAKPLTAIGTFIALYFTFTPKK